MRLYATVLISLKLDLCYFLSKWCCNCNIMERIHFIWFNFLFSKIMSKFLIFFSCDWLLWFFFFMLNIVTQSHWWKVQPFLFTLYTHVPMVTFKNIWPYMNNNSNKKLKLYTQLKHLKHNVHSFWYTGFITSYWRDNVIQMWCQTDTL